MSDTKPKKSEQYQEKPGGQFKRGNPGGGRKKGSLSITDLVKKELQKCPEGHNKKTYADLVVKRILKNAIEQGDDKMIGRIWAYMDGLPRQNLDLTSGGDKMPAVQVKQIKGMSEEDLNDYFSKKFQDENSK